VSARSKVQPWLVGVLGFAFAVGLALRLLIPNEMDPSIFVAFGSGSPDQTSYAQRLLGDVMTRPGGGHDGQAFFIQANDPWFIEPEENAALLDYPVYRAQRMLFPMVAGGLGLFPPGVVVWTMLIVNLLALGVGAFLAATLAVEWGCPPWLGLAVPLNVGLLFELDIGGSGVLAYVCCLGAVWALLRDRFPLAAILFAAGALSRETMVAFAVGVFLLYWFERRQLLWPIVVAPITALAVWDAYIWVRLRDIPGAVSAPRSVGPPLFGLIDAGKSWLDHPLDLVTSLVLVAVVAAFIPIAMRTRLPIAWGAIPFVALALILSANVWREPFDSSRAIAPILTAYPFLVMSPNRALAPVDRSPGHGG
jgi:hypothetical protein